MLIFHDIITLLSFKTLES